ncbi:MAG TPA: YbaK/EbsC family protein [Desulfobacterales bacterium]|jgi:prolyl-tRNA editing enzyme YbaK/EbsC (Cys-tRNA(Pro) deacylase)|nr:YbaK/EbsC family protein [Desulfobacterales bacterium]
MTNEISTNARRVQDALDGLGLSQRVKEMKQTTRSAQDAARAVGCEVGQIAKSLVFKGAASQRAILVITSGANRVNEASLAEISGETVLKADAEFVRTQAGYAIGGVPPVGHPQPLTVFIDEDLLNYPLIWAAAGTPQAVFHLTPQELLRITGGTVVCVK